MMKLLTLTFGRIRQAAEERCPDAALQPWPALHLVAVGALILRLVVAWWSERISHPDELFQYLEQAHRLVYGYGVVPWEYRFGTRNWLLPGGLAAVLGALHTLGLDSPSAYAPLLRSVIALVSVSVVYASYAIARHLLGEQTGRVAAVMAAVWYELLYYATVPTPEVLGAYAILAALGLCLAPRKPGPAVAAGLLLGLAVALRLQYAVPAASVAMLALLRWGWGPACRVAIGGALVVGGAGLVDLWTWGTPFLSFYNAVLFNVAHGISSLFGERPAVWYVEQLTLRSAGLFAVAVPCGVAEWRRAWPVLLVIGCTVGSHMLIGHKEYRFVFLAIPLLLVLAAHGFVLLPRIILLLSPWTSAMGVAIHGRQARAVVQGSKAAAIGAFCLVTVLKAQPDGPVGGLLKRDDRLLATLDLSRRPDVVAVLDAAGGIWKSGAYYYLHKDIPYYFLKDVTELRLAERRQVVSHMLIREGDYVPPGFRVSTRFGSVFVLEQTSPPQSYMTLKTDGRAPEKLGITDRLTPAVRPWPDP